jgi:hypothetical protein
MITEKMVTTIFYYFFKLKIVKHKVSKPHLFFILALLVLFHGCASTSQSKNNSIPLEKVFYELSLSELPDKLIIKNKAKNNYTIWIRKILDSRFSGRLVSEGKPVVVIKEPLRELIASVLKKSFEGEGFEVHRVKKLKPNSKNITTEENNLIILDCVIKSFWTKTYFDEDALDGDKYISYAEIALRLNPKSNNKNKSHNSFYLIGENKLISEHQPNSDTYFSLFKKSFDDALADSGNLLFKIISDL